MYRDHCTGLSSHQIKIAVRSRSARADTWSKEVATMLAFASYIFCMENGTSKCQSCFVIIYNDDYDVKIVQIIINKHL